MRGGSSEALTIAPPSNYSLYLSRPLQSRPFPLATSPLRLTLPPSFLVATPPAQPGAAPLRLPFPPLPSPLQLPHPGAGGIHLHHPGQQPRRQHLLLYHCRPIPVLQGRHLIGKLQGKAVHPRMHAHSYAHNLRSSPPSPSFLQILGFWEGQGSIYNKPCCSMTEVRRSGGESKDALVIAAYCGSFYLISKGMVIHPWMHTI